MRKIVRVPYITHCNLLALICNGKNVDAQLQFRIMKFLFISVVNSADVHVRHMETLYKLGSHVCPMLNALQQIESLLSCIVLTFKTAFFFRY